MRSATYGDHSRTIQRMRKSELVDRLEQLTARHEGLVETVQKLGEHITELRAEVSRFEDQAATVGRVKAAQEGLATTVGRLEEQVNQHLTVQNGKTAAKPVKAAPRKRTAR